MLTGKQKHYLRSKGMTMKPLVSVGKNGLTDTFTAGVQAAIEKRELIKITLQQSAEETPQAVGEWLQNALPGLEIAQIIGRTLLVYRRASKPDNRHISLEVTAL